MRDIYDIKGAITNDDEKFFGFQILVPDIKLVDLTFVKPGGINMANGNFVNEMNITFNNGSNLKIEGIFLHKFFNEVPDEVSDEEGDYIQTNPYSDNYTTERMVGLIRKGFTILLEECSVDTEVERLKQLTLAYDEEGCKINKVLYLEIPEATRNRVNELMRFNIESNKKLHDTQLSDFIQDSLLKPKIKRDMIREGEMLRNSFVEVEWGDISTLNFKDFLFSLDPYREEGIPYYTNYSDRLKDYAKKHSKEALNKAIQYISENEPEHRDIIYSYLFQEDSIDFDIKKVEAFGNLMNDEEYSPAVVLSDYWWDNNTSKTIAQIIS